MNTKTQSLIKKFLSLTKKDSLVNVYHADSKTIFEDTLGNNILIQENEFDWQLPEGMYYNDALRDLNPEFCSPKFLGGGRKKVKFNKGNAVLLPGECLENLFKVSKVGRYMPGHFTHNVKILSGFCAATDGRRFLRMSFPFEVEYYTSNDLLKLYKRLKTDKSKLYWYDSTLWILTEEEVVMTILKIHNTPIEWPDIDLFSVFDDIVEERQIQNISDLQLEEVTLPRVEDEVVCFNGKIKSYYFKHDIKAVSVFPPRKAQFRKMAGNLYAMFILGNNGEAAIIAPVNPQRQ
jgi:hypothetical protein